MQFTEEAMRARFHELGALSDEKLAVSTPLREQRDAIVQAAREQEDALNAQIAEAEEGLFDIDMERGALARALKGKTGLAE